MYIKQNRATCKYNAHQQRAATIISAHHCQRQRLHIISFAYTLLLVVATTASSATVFQKTCKFGSISTIDVAKGLCQGLGAEYFMAMPATTAENNVVKGLLSLFQTAILGGSRRTYSTAYTFEHGPFEGETFLVNSGGGGGTAVSGYYNDFGGSANFGSAAYVVAIDSGGWKSYTLGGFGGATCVICASKSAAEVCSVIGTKTVASGPWLSSSSCVCNDGFRGPDCGLQFQTYCDGPFATLDAYNAQCNINTAGMYLATPFTQSEYYQIGRSIPQHLTVNYLLGGTKDVTTGYWSWGYGPYIHRSFFDEVSRQNVNYWATGEALLGGTDTSLVQLSTLGWYDESGGVVGTATCYACQMRSCSLTCNAANTLITSGSMWPSCTCTCKPGFSGPTCDCPVYGCYEVGLETMEWVSGSLDKCGCVCKPKFFAPYCYPTPTMSLSLSMTTPMSTSSSPTYTIPSTLSTPRTLTQDTFTHTQSMHPTTSISRPHSVSIHTSSPTPTTSLGTPTLSSPHTHTNPLTLTFSPSQTLTWIRTLSHQHTPTSELTGTSSIMTTRTSTLSIPPAPTPTSTPTPSPISPTLSTTIPTVSPAPSPTESLGASATHTKVYIPLPLSERPSCPRTSVTWYQRINETLLTVGSSGLTDRMVRDGAVVVNITILETPVVFRSASAITFGVESIGVSDPRSFPSVVNFADISCQFETGSFSTIICSLPASPDYAIRTAEVLTVEGAVEGTTLGTCRPAGSKWVVGSVTVTPAKADVVLESLQAAFAVAASVATAVIIIFADGSPIETQVLVMMMDSPCASNIDRASVEWIKYIVMPASDGGITWMMGGNILIAIGFFAIHAIIVGIVFAVRLRAAGGTKESRRSVFIRTCTTMMFPGMSANISQVMYAGVSYGTMGTLRTQSGLSATVAAAGLLYMLLVPACVLYILMKVAAVVYHRYDWAAEGVPASKAWLYPHGFWVPKEDMRRLHSIVGPYRVGMHYGVLFPFVFALVVGLLMNAVVSIAPCDYLYVAVGVISVLSAVLTLALNPRRAKVQSILTALCLGFLGLLAILQILAMRTNLEILVTLKAVCNYLLIAHIVLRTAHSIFIFILEYRTRDTIISSMRSRGIEINETEGVVPQNRNKYLHGTAAAADDDDDDEGPLDFNTSHHSSHLDKSGAVDFCNISIAPENGIGTTANGSVSGGGGIRRKQHHQPNNGRRKSVVSYIDTIPINGPPGAGEGGGGLSVSSFVMNADDELLFSEEEEDFMGGFMCRPGESGIYSPNSKVGGKRGEYSRGGNSREDTSYFGTTVDLGESLYRTHSRADSSAFQNRMKKQNQLFGSVGDGAGGRRGYRTQSGNNLPRMKSSSRMMLGGGSRRGSAFVFNTSTHLCNSAVISVASSNDNRVVRRRRRPYEAKRPIDESSATTSSQRQHNVVRIVDGGGRGCFSSATSNDSLPPIHHGGDDMNVSTIVGMLDSCRPSPMAADGITPTTFPRAATTTFPIPQVSNNNNNTTPSHNLAAAATAIFNTPKPTPYTNNRGMTPPDQHVDDGIDRPVAISSRGLKRRGTVNTSMWRFDMLAMRGKGQAVEFSDDEELEGGDA